MEEHIADTNENDGGSTTIRFHCNYSEDDLDTINTEIVKLNENISVLIKLSIFESSVIVAILAFLGMRQVLKGFR